MNVPLAKLALAALFASAATACPADKPAGPQPVQTIFFPAADVCGYPSASLTKAIRELGGGKWELPKSSSEGASFECVGGASSIFLLSNGATIVQIDYTASGNEKGASLITATYSAIGPVPNESTYRNVFGAFVEGLSKQAMGVAPPDLLRKKIANLASYPQPGKGSPENFDVGPGFIALTREGSQGEAVSVTVKLYPDIALKISN